MDKAYLRRVALYIAAAVLSVALIVYIGYHIRRFFTKDIETAPAKIVEREFTVRDTYRSITKVSEDRVFITDVDGNRFEIPSLAALDRRSRRKIELFL